MKGIYLSQDLTHADGILEKINLQIDEFENNGYSMTTHINGKRNSFHLARNLMPFFSEQYFKTKNIDWTSYDFAYIRKGAVLDKSVIELVKKAKKTNPKIKIILEIPTYPYLDEFNGLVKIDIALKERRWTKKLSQYIDRIVTYSDDKEIFDIQCINISNAYEFKQLGFSREEAEDQTIHLIGVATLCFYHGYDRLIEGLKEYNQKMGQKTKVVFNLIGDGPVLSEYQKLVKDYKLEKIVTLNGRKKMFELDTYYKEANIGVDSLGRHRSGVTYNSSLKGKEYLAKGLPIISGVKTDLDDKDISFYYRVPNDDTPINIDAIVGWYQNLTSNKSQKQLSKEIYQYGQTNFTFSITFSPVIDYLGGALHE